MSTATPARKSNREQITVFVRVLFWRKSMNVLQFVSKVRGLALLNWTDELTWYWWDQSLRRYKETPRHSIGSVQQQEVHCLKADFHKGWQLCLQRVELIKRDNALIYLFKFHDHSEDMIAYPEWRSTEQTMETEEALELDAGRIVAQQQLPRLARRILSARCWLLCVR